MLEVNSTMKWFSKKEEDIFAKIRIVHCLTFEDSPFQHSWNRGKISDICMYTRIYMYMYIYNGFVFSIRYLQKKCSKVCSL